MSPPVTRCHKLQSFGSAALRALIVRRRRFLLAHQIIKQWKVPNDFLSTSPDHRLARSRVNSHVVVPSAVNFSISVIAEPAGKACLQPGELLNPICPAGFQLHLPTRGIELVAFWCKVGYWREFIQLSVIQKFPHALLPAHTRCRRSCAYQPNAAPGKKQNSVWVAKRAQLQAAIPGRPNGGCMKTGGTKKYCSDLCSISLDFTHTRGIGSGRGAKSRHTWTPNWMFLKTDSLLQLPRHGPRLPKAAPGNTARCAAEMASGDQVAICWFLETKYPNRYLRIAPNLTTTEPCVPSTPTHKTSQDISIISIISIHIRHILFGRPWTRPWRRS